MGQRSTEGGHSGRSHYYPPRPVRLESGLKSRLGNGTVDPETPSTEKTGLGVTQEDLFTPDYACLRLVEGE